MSDDSKPYISFPPNPVEFSSFEDCFSQRLSGLKNEDYWIPAITERCSAEQSPDIMNVILGNWVTLILLFQHSCFFLVEGSCIFL